MTAYGAPVTLDSMLAHGAGALIKLRLATVPQMLYRIVWVIVGFGAIFVPCAAFGKQGGGQTRLPETAGGVAFLATVIGVYGFILPAVGGFSALRSFNALLPLTAVLIVAGILHLGATYAVRRMLYAGVFLFYLLAGIMADQRAVAESNRSGDDVRHIASVLRSDGIEPESGALIMTGDSAQFSETTGYAAVPLPSNGWQGIDAAIKHLAPVRIIMKDSEYKIMQRQFGPATAQQVSGTDDWIVAPSTTTANPGPSGR